MKTLFNHLLIVLAVAFAVTPFRALAEPAHPQPVTIKQPDGTMFTLSLVGDEFYHYNTTTDGFTVVKNAHGAWEYAKMSGNNLVPSGLLAHNFADRSASENAFLNAQPRHAFSISTRNKAQAKRNFNEAQRRKESQFDYNNFKGLLILINYNDKQFSMNNPKSFYNDLCNTKNYTGFTWQGSKQNCPGSVRDYFFDNSNGLFDPHFDVYGPVNVDLSCTSAQGTGNAEPIFKAAMDALDPQVDFSQYDTDNDGFIDMIFFMVAGYSASYSGNNGDYLWPHKYYLFNSAQSAYYEYDGVCPWVYACSTEIYGWEAYGYTMPNAIGTMCHEFTHVLGFPDLYDTDYATGGSSHHPGDWDVMAGGGSNYYGRYPVGYSLFERYALGFATPTTITQPGNYRLPVLDTSNTGFIMRSDVPNEYFVFENRQKNNKWERYLPGTGMVVARVDSTDIDIWYSNRLNANPSHNYYELLRAGGGTDGSSDSDPFPGTANVTSLTNTTTANLKTWNGTFSPLIIENIAENNGIISFKVSEESSITKIVEDFEIMPTTTQTNQKNVQGNFAYWSFTKSNVTKQNFDDNYSENHAVAMVSPSTVEMSNTIYLDIKQLSLTVKNNTSVTAKYRLYYKENADDSWTQANTNDIEAPSKSTGTYTIPFSHQGKVMLRVAQVGGSQNAKVYLDNVTISCSLTLGDVNLDGDVNVSDVTTLISMILGDTPQYLPIADINQDGDVNVSDVTDLINKILGN